MSAKSPSAPLDSPQARALFAICIVFSLLATLAIAARFYSRRLKRVSLGTDDWLSLVGLFFYYLQVITTIIGIFQGYIGHHSKDLSLGEIIVAGKVALWAQYTYALALGLTRCSICILFIRVFQTPTFKKLTYGALILNFAWILFSIFFLSLRCIPFAKNWDPEITTGHCANENNFIIAVAVWGLICDAIIWALPIPMVLRLHLPLAHRLALSGVFATGILDIVVGIVRVTSVLSIDFMDFTYSGVEGIEWAILEPGIALLVASAPMLRPIFDKMIPHSLIKKKLSKVASSKDHSHVVTERPYGPLGDDDIELLQSDAKLKRGVTDESISKYLHEPVPPAPVAKTTRDAFAD